MNTENIKYRLSHELGNMAELILKRKSPYDNLPIHEEAANYLYIKYIKYCNEIKEPLRQKILEYIIDETKYYFFLKLLPIQEIPKFSDHEEAESNFRDWIKQKEGEIQYYPSDFKPTEKLKINQIINKAMKKRRPDFLYDKGASDSYTRYFSKTWIYKYKCFIGVNWGTKRDFLDFYIGINSPFLDGVDIYSTTIASFFGGVQAVYPYDSEAQAFKAMDKALDLIDQLLPFFLQRMEKFIELNLK